MPWTPRFALTLAALAAAGCHREDPPPPAPSPSAAPSGSTVVSVEAPARESYDLLAHLDACEVRHRGVFLDLGTAAARRHRKFEVGPFDDLVDAEREGATVSRMVGLRVGYELLLDEPVEDVVLSVRAHGGSAKHLSAILDDKRLGTVKLVPGEMRELTFPALHGTLPAGRHTLSLSLSGRPRGSTEPGAELDWLRLSASDELGPSYAAPTFRDLVSDAALDGMPRRAIALRAPGAVRCPLLPAADAQLRADLGFWGDGKGALEVRIVADGEAPQVVAEHKVMGGPGATWIPLRVPLKEYAGRLVALELRATETTKGGRVLFGDPAVVRTAPSEHVPVASTVVIVIASGLDRRAIPPWGPVRDLATLSELAKKSTIFSEYRAPTTVTPAVVASLVTGLPPRLHALEDPAARLPTQARTLGELVKEASGRTAMFTGVPETFAAFGFDQGWDKFASTSPVSDVDAAQPILDAAKWLDAEVSHDENARRLVVVHARGAHPPWDLTKEEAARLPPEEYGGLLDPRRGGVVLAKLRTQQARHKKKLADEDWTRLNALVYAALVKQDAALGQLVSVLKSKNEWDSTLFILVGDVSPGEPPEVPFDPAGDLEEARLIAPLLVKFPGGKLATKEVAASVGAVDVTATVLAALRLKPGAGLDLFAVADGLQPLAGRGMVATLSDHYSTRLGHWLLRGELGKPPVLCALDVDPACVTNVFADRPLSGWAAWQSTYDAYDAATRDRVAPREPASIDPDTGAALMVWGDI